MKTGGKGREKVGQEGKRVKKGVKRGGQGVWTRGGEKGRREKGGKRRKK